MRESSRRKRSAASHADTLCRLDSKPAARPKRGRHAREERERRKILTTSSEPRERLLVLMHRRFRSPRRAERRIYRLMRTRRRAAVSKTAGRRIEANRAIPSRVYDILKWLGLIVLPALALFVNTVGPAWGWTHVDAIVTTLNALGILAGALIGVSAIKQRLDLAA